jgi:alpha-mannosidase
MPRIHVIANAHLDPVWLWDWREGLNEGIATCRTVLGLMDEFPELTFARGEASIYEHIGQHDPETFARIRAQIAQGRWDVVGGNYVQPDTNLPATEVLVRQFKRGLGYFKRALNVRPTVAWAPDSFGHSAGWPEIYAAAGMTSLAFSRPFSTDLKLPGHAFWWEGPGGSRILAWRMPIGWYGSTRVEVQSRLDQYWAAMAAWGLENIPVFFGLGNHGGGPSRGQIETILRWRDHHPDVTVEFSTLHRFFAALAEESAGLPVFRGELNFALRGCYSTGAAVKFAYRRTENLLLQTERTVTAVAAVTSTVAPDDLREAWDAVLFNTFHDVLPGTSIERALADQRSWLGQAWHQTQRAELGALNRLAAQIDTSVPPAQGDRPTVVPVLLWNSLPVPFNGPVEFEVPLDYRPIDDFRHKTGEVPLVVRDARGRALPFQCVTTENDFAPEVPWRKRFVVRLQIPPCGWEVVTAGWATNDKTVAQPADLQARPGRIKNRHWIIRAKAGAAGIIFSSAGTARRRAVALQLRAVTMDDPWGSWGGHDGEAEADHINRVKAAWKIDAVELLERGPERAALWVRLTQGASRLELTVHLYRDDPAIIVRARVFWTEKAARLKLMFSRGGVAEFEVPGGTVLREPCGEVPGGRWVRVGQGPHSWCFASDALYNFDVTAKTFGATVVRSCPYATSNRSRRTERPWRSYMDLGEHGFQFALGDGEADPAALAQRLESPPVALMVPAGAGRLPRRGGALGLSAGLKLLAFTRAESPDAWLLRVQNALSRRVNGAAVFLGTKISLGSIPAGRIHTVLFQPAGRRWKAIAVNAAEEPVSAPSHL